MEFKTITPLADGRILFISTGGVSYIGTIIDATNQIVLTKYLMVRG